MSDIVKFKIKTSEGVNAVQALVGTRTMVTMTAGVPGAKQTKAAHNDANDDTDANEYYNWGEDNLWPTTVRCKLEDSAIAYPLIYKMVCMMFGSGVQYFRRKKVGNEIQIEYFESPEIEKFFTENDIDRFMLEQFMDFKFYGNAFSESILTKNLKKICNLYHLEAEFSRIGKQNDDTKKVENLFYSGNFVTDISVNDPIKIPFLNRRDRSKEGIARVGKGKKKFAWQTFFPSPGRTTYAKPPHSALYKKDGWLDYENSIPVTLNSIIKNQLNIKYHIKIPYSYWPSMYPDWNNYKQKKRDELIDSKLKEMEEWLSGNKNAGKSLITHFAIDPITNKPIPGFEIEVVENKFKEGDFVPASDAADAKIVRALGVDPSIAGLQPQGGKMGAGSGSDKREAFNNTIELSKADARILFEPLYTVRDYNGWGDDVEFGFSHQLSTTTDDEPNGKKPESVETNIENAKNNQEVSTTNKLVLEITNKGKLKKVLNFFKSN